jgi:hypothetical protein
MNELEELTEFYPWIFICFQNGFKSQNHGFTNQDFIFIIDLAVSKLIFKAINIILNLNDFPSFFRKLNCQVNLDS